MEKLFSFLKAHNLTVGSCESFTAGLFANQFCQIPGASQFFKGAIVCYSEEIKERILFVPKKIIKKYDVVSSQVSELMAKNGAKVLNCDICFSFTGYAPPSKNEHTGLSYMSIFFQDKVLTLKWENFKIANRNAYQMAAIEEILNFFKKNVTLC